MDMETFKSVVIPFKDKLYRYAYRIVQSEEEAKDVVQETFIKIWKNARKLTEVANPEAWCMTITRNMALDMIRTKHKTMTESLEGKNSEPAAQAETGSPGEERIFRDVVRIIETLPDKQRQVIHLRDIEGYTYDEISEILKITMSQVKVTLHRARNSVREQLIKVEDYEF